jgi:hypothetical protein
VGAGAAVGAAGGALVAAVPLVPPWPQAASSSASTITKRNLGRMIFSYTKPNTTNRG